MAPGVGFRYDVISCKLARRGVWHGAAEASGGGVQRVLSLQRGRSDSDP